MHQVLEVDNLVKMYGSFRAVDGISFRVPKGKIVGFLGPNGAGKTTTIQMLLGITTPTAGTIRFFGKDFNSHRTECLQRINFTSSFNTLLGRITVLENLEVFAMLYGVRDYRKKVRELTRYFGADDISSQLYTELSAGQRARVNIIKALLNDPEIILMDEPTASLDPDIADKTLSLIEELKHRQQISILYTSHDMEEITRVCDEVIFLDHGKIVAQDTPLNLTKRIENVRLQLVFEGDKHILQRYFEEKKQPSTFLNDYTVSVETREKEVPKLIFGVSKTGIYVTDIDVKKPSLEDVFLQIARKQS